MEGRLDRLGDRPVYGLPARRVLNALYTMAMDNADEKTQDTFLEELWRTPEEWIERYNTRRRRGLELVHEIGEVAS